MLMLRAGEARRLLTDGPSFLSFVVSVSRPRFYSKIELSGILLITVSRERGTRLREFASERRLTMETYMCGFLAEG